MNSELEVWFTANQKRLETAYIDKIEPWQQSGYSGPQERWVACRQPIADCIDRPGTFLDIGCANGYLLECLWQWTDERAIEIQPYGLDISTQLAALAKQRLAVPTNIFVGNAWTWVPPMKFDFVRTEVNYVPESLRASFVRRLMKLFVQPLGKLLITEYRSSKESQFKPWIDERLQAWGISVAHCRSGYYQGKELTRIAVVG